MAIGRSRSIVTFAMLAYHGSLNLQVGSVDAEIDSASIVRQSFRQASAWAGGDCRENAQYSRVRGGHTETLERMFHEPNKQLGATMGVVATRLSARNASRCCN